MGKHRQQDLTNLCLEYLFPMHVGLEIHTVGACGSDVWLIDLHNV